MRLQVSVFLCSLLVLPSAAHAQATNPPDDYIWAAACKDCHAPEYRAWEKTKHAHALNRLSTSERETGGCVTCHVTGATGLVSREANANVQCEACHGPGRRHMEGDPEAITRKPGEKVCVGCHNDKGPHYKYFLYAALAPLVHPAEK
jgi:predicted CXXCH cytochrome family protein